MVSFLNLMGVVFWFVGLTSCTLAKGAMHETNGMMQVLVGTVCVIGAAVLDEMRRHRPRPPPPVLGPGDKATDKAWTSRPTKSFWSKLFK